VTLVQVFSFLTESLLYRANQIPERNRRAFLHLLGVPIRPASSARGMITVTNEKGRLRTETLARDLEVRAGQVPFRTRTGLDVLPIETGIYYKRPLRDPEPRLRDYYRQLHASFLDGPVADVTLYETAPLPPPMNGTPPAGIDLAADTVDGSLWIALMLRRGDLPREASELPAMMAEARAAIAGMTLSLGIVPDIAAEGVSVQPVGPAVAGEPLLQYAIPNGGTLGPGRTPTYAALPSRQTTNVLAEPGVVEIDLPTADRLRLWDDMEPLEAGTGDFPPLLDEMTVGPRVITWLRVRLPDAGERSGEAVRHRPRIRWACINAAMVDQRVRVTAERLGDGTGQPDQRFFLTRTPVIPGTVWVTTSRTAPPHRRRWTETDDLLAAAPEGPDDDTLAPGDAEARANPAAHVFTLDAESGEIRFGDGLHGRRPPWGAAVVADYDAGMGRDGNVGIGAISTGAALPAAMKIANPIPTWGGDAGETVADGEKQISRYLQHRDRLVTEEDFATVTWRTPGVDLGRVDILPAFNPALSPNEPGDAPGAVTILALPRFDRYHPDAPEPDQHFLDSICAYDAPRRLVTTELHVRGPRYVPVWVSVGFEVVPGVSFGEVREAVKRAIRAFLAPIPDPGVAGQAGWPLRKAVAALELWAVANRVPGVAMVNEVLLAPGAGAPAASVAMRGLELPRLAGVEARAGDPLAIDSLRSQVAPGGPDGSGEDGDAPAVTLPVPVIPEECR
jgi:hypothetical protein